MTHTRVSVRFKPSRLKALAIALSIIATVLLGCALMHIGAATKTAPYGKTINRSTLKFRKDTIRAIVHPKKGGK